ncbi:elongation factor Ts [Candidatus Dojkabacteria bacterium]|uniref:Elongation factor Ts n=1 Tax=Candidatus Dojkabacteria bacterium TaxID=2099670 RepID=A0A955HZ02_9BACT|nr:elongation factor Ts [Candidatus Dojkabacteria bacterium]
MKVDVKDIVMLRNKTSAGMALCKEALEASKGSIEEAIEYINKKSDVVSRLHNVTGAKIGLCKIALGDSDQDFEAAVKLIEDRGWATDSVEVEQSVGEGAIGVYLHGVDRRTAALVEVSCLTDFVARNEDFIKLTNELAIQAAATKPMYVDSSSIPEEKIKELTELYRREAKEEGKPEEMLDKIVQGKLNKFYSENCLLDQKWFKDESQTMREYIDQMIGQLGEPLTVKRVLVWQFGK